MMFRTLGTVALLSLAFACGGAASPPVEPTPTPAPGPTAITPVAPPAPAADAASQSCDVDADCVIVELGCCDHCNGGKVDAFNKASAASKKPTCEATACTKRGCEPATASCVAHRCVAKTS